MQIPRYWVRATVDAQGRPFSHPPRTDNLLGRRPGTWAFGWSDTSLEDARRMGIERAQAILRKLQSDEEIIDQYGYPDRPMREEIIRRGENDRWLITHNAYGSLVLNTASVMFVDIDLPWRPKAGWLNRLLRRYEHTPENQVIQRVRDAVSHIDGLSGRLYRTAAGLRLLVISETYDPTSDQTQDIMTHLNADHQYMFLCQKQASFRARLSPKPWRCGKGFPSPRWRYPYETPEQQADIAQWVRQYEQFAKNHSVCQFIETLGSAQITPETAPEVAPLIALHDHYCCSDPKHPLA